MIVNKQERFGSWEIQWEIDETESIFLTFDHEPTDAEVQAEADKYITNRFA